MTIAMKNLKSLIRLIAVSISLALLVSHTLNPTLVEAGGKGGKGKGHGGNIIISLGGGGNKGHGYPVPIPIPIHCDGGKSYWHHRRRR